MRRLAIAGILLACCTLVATAQENASPSELPSTGGNWFTRLFSSGDKPEVQKAEEKKKAEPVNAVESTAPVRVREDIILNRRNQACWKLREIAVRTGDSALLRKADELEVRANELFFQRMADLTARAQAQASKASHTEVPGPRQEQKTHSSDDSTRGEER